MDLGTGLFDVGQTAAESSEEEMQHRILAELKRNGRMTRTELENAVRGDKSLITRAVRGLVPMFVEQAGSGKKGDPFTFELANPS